MKKEENKKSFINKLDYLLFFVFAGLFAVAAASGIFEKWDFRLYDSLLRLKKEPHISEKIAYGEIDDVAIQQIGSWPWTRDIIADCLIYLKEFGAERAVFDIEYLSPSKKALDRNMEQFLLEKIDQTSSTSIDYMNQIFRALSQGYKPWEFKKDIMNAQTQNLEELKSVFSEVYQDYDDYFARSLQFFGNSWLTLNTRDIGITENETEFVDTYMLLKNVKDAKSFTEKNNIYNGTRQNDRRSFGFTPALPLFMQSAKGMGFTNVNIDSDGTRRRIELLFEHDGKYAAQLVFAPFLQLSDAQGIERSKRKITVKGVLLPGKTEREDITIPLDANGTMLINWLHKDFGDSFKHIFLGEVYSLKGIENQIYDDLYNIVNSNPLKDKKGRLLSYNREAKKLISDYEKLLSEKEKLLSLCNENSLETGISQPVSDQQYEHYFSGRKAFFEALKAFRESFHDHEIFEAIYNADYLTEDAKESYWNAFVGNFTTEEIAKKIWNTWDPAQEDFDYNQTRYGLFTDLYYYADLYETIVNEIKPLIKDSFIIIGETASSTTDMGANPFFNRFANVGTHANVLNTIIQKDFITPINWYIGYCISVILMGIVLFSSHSSSRKLQNILNGIIFGLCFTISLLLLPVASIYIPSFCILIFGLCNYLSGVAVRYVLSSREKDFIKNTFSTFVSKDVVNEIIKNPELGKLGGKDMVCTALFSDIKKFSTFSEKIGSPVKLGDILNEYLGTMSDEILKNRGTIDKFIGDSIVSMFGAPISFKDHAYWACVSAIMMKKAEAEFNKKHMIEGDIPNELFTRIGINTGHMTVGNFGTENKLNYTMLGDEVNLASRLEGANKAYDSWILCSEETWKNVDYGEHKGKILAKKLDRVRVVGKNKPVQLYTILGFRDEMSKLQIDEVDLFHEALDLYLKKKFVEAGKLFLQANEMIPEDKAALKFAERCKNYISSGVSSNWEGVFDLTEK